MKLIDKFKKKLDSFKKECIVEITKHQLQRRTTAILQSQALDNQYLANVDNYNKVIELMKECLCNDCVTEAKLLAFELRDFER